MGEEKKLTFSDLDYLVDFDDRVCCNGCPMADVATDREFVAPEKASALKGQGKPIGFPGDKIENKGDWVVVSWTYGVCSVDGSAMMPSGMLHRCDHIKPAGYERMSLAENTPSKSNAKPEAATNWWDD